MSTVPRDHWPEYVIEGSELAVFNVMSFGLMLTVLVASNQPKLSKWTGVFAGALLLMYISAEAPYSGMSINPARTVGSAFAAHVWTALWVYLLAPPLGMLSAAAVYVRVPAWPEVTLERLGSSWKRAHIVVLAGGGGNGGGGMCAACHLANRDMDVALVLSEPGRLGDVPSFQRKVFAPTRGRELEIAALGHDRADLIIDALIG